MNPALIGFLLGGGLWVPAGWCLRALVSAAERETRPLPERRPQLRLVTGEEIERRAAEAHALTTTRVR